MKGFPLVLSCSVYLGYHPPTLAHGALVSHPQHTLPLMLANSSLASLTSEAILTPRGTQGRGGGRGVAALPTLGTLGMYAAQTKQALSFFLAVASPVGIACYTCHIYHLRTTLPYLGVHTFHFPNSDIRVKKQNSSSNTLRSRYLPGFLSLLPSRSSSSSSSSSTADILSLVINPLLLCSFAPLLKRYCPKAWEDGKVAAFQRFCSSHVCTCHEKETRRGRERGRA